MDIYAPRNTKAVPDLQQVFAAVILDLEGLEEFDGDKRVYVLDALADREFAFQVSPESGIENVAVRLLRLSLLAGRKRKLTLEADTTISRKAVYDLLEQISPPAFHVTQAEIRVTFCQQPGTRRRVRSFKISYPNWCALRHDERALTIRKMLVDSGIEPVELEATTDNAEP